MSHIYDGYYGNSGSSNGATYDNGLNRTNSRKVIEIFFDNQRQMNKMIDFFTKINHFTINFNSIKAFKSFNYFSKLNNFFIKKNYF
jgi:hypothetical protein